MNCGDFCTICAQSISLIDASAAALGWHAETYFTDENTDGMSYCVAHCSHRLTLSYILHFIFEVRPEVIMMNKIHINEQDQ